MYVKIQLQYISSVIATYNLWMSLIQTTWEGIRAIKAFFCQMPVSLGVRNLWRKRCVKMRNWKIEKLTNESNFDICLVYHSVISWLWVNFLSLQRIQYPSRDIIIKWRSCKMLKHSNYNWVEQSYFSLQLKDSQCCLNFLYLEVLAGSFQDDIKELLLFLNLILYMFKENVFSILHC